MYLWDGPVPVTDSISHTYSFSFSYSGEAPIGQLYKCLCRGPGPVEGVGGGGAALTFLGSRGGGGGMSVHPWVHQWYVHLYISLMIDDNWSLYVPCCNYKCQQCRPTCTHSHFIHTSSLHSKIHMRFRNHLFFARSITIMMIF